MFSERFDTLMKIAEVSNSLLSRYTHMDNSYISRLRSGKRPLPRNHDYLTSICAFLAGRIKQDYQFNALRQLIDIDYEVFKDKDSLAKALEEWLAGRQIDSVDSVQKLVSSFSTTDFRQAVSSSLHPEADNSEVFFYGNSGKEAAVEKLLLNVLKEDSPQTLLFYTDESEEWLYENKRFSRYCLELFLKILDKGNHALLIHSSPRDYSSILELITLWLPIYMTGMAKPYFYPRLRDGVYQRTVFIAPKTGAVISSSIHYDTSEMLNLYISDQEAIRALRLEFERYHALCTPLMKTYSAGDMEEFHKSCHELFCKEGNLEFYSSTPPLLTLPEDLANELFDTEENAVLYEIWEREHSSFLTQLETRPMYLITTNPEAESMQSERFNIPVADISTFENLSYSHDQYKRHIEYINDLEKKYDNLKIKYQDEIIGNIVFYVKDDAGSIMIKRDDPKIAFITENRNFTNALWDFFLKITSFDILNK